MLPLLLLTSSGFVFTNGETMHKSHLTVLFMNQASESVARAPRILIVEDDSDLTLLLSYNLEAEGYVAETVMSGDEADLRLTESVPDLVILDWMLPGLSGIENMPTFAGTRRDS